jgi:hypothetical protein
MMRVDQAIRIVEREWERQNGCASCNWAAWLSEYGDDLASELTINERMKRIELPCLSKDAEEPCSHRGVRIYWNADDEIEVSNGS